MSADKAAAIKKTDSKGSSGSIFIPAVLALVLIVLNVVLSIAYYNNQDVYDLRWVLAILDLSIILSFYAMAGKRVSHLLVSMKLALTLLLVLAILSIIGTILPQGEKVINSGWIDNPLYNFYRHLGLFDMYHSRWFLALLFLLAFNLIVCIYNRLPTAIKHVMRPRIDVKDIFITSQPLSAEIDAPGGNAMSLAREVLSDHHYRIREGNTGSVMAEKGRFAGLYSLSFHLSFLLIGLGAIIISFTGFEERLEIPDGATASVPGTELQVTNHGFQMETVEVRENDRVVGYRPSVYSSDLELFDNGESVARKTITVNDPLRYGGINFHQASYYRTGRGYVTVLSVNKSPGKSLIYLGFGAMMGGIVLGLYFPHRRIWFKMGESGKLLVGGRTNRAKMSFQQDFDNIITELRSSK